MLLVASGGVRASARRLALTVTLAAAALAIPLAGSAQAATPVAASPAAAVAPDAVVAAPVARASSTRAGFARRAAKVRAKKVATLLRAAAALKGRPYRYGARGPSSFDCSGFTGFIMKRAGEALPRTSGEQYSAATKISKSQLRPGDLVFFRNGRHVYHVAVYAGHNRIWHARQPGQGVALTPISAHSWVAGRVL